MKLKQKIPYNIRKSLVKILPWALLLGTPVATGSCGKDPMPTRKVVIDWDWSNLPKLDTIALCAKQKDVDSIILNLRDDNTLGWSPWTFHRARDTLQKRFDIAPTKIRGRGTIIVGRELGAQHPSYGIEAYEPGMALVDSIWFSNWGFRVMTEQTR
jgi:hypothetical protein